MAYEGGPSIYTNQIEDADPVKGPQVTRFMSAMNRHPRMAEVYAIHLNMARSHGLTTHNPFVLVSAWGRYGQWGHLESLDQDPDAAVKYRFLLDWFDLFSHIRHVDDPQGEVPAFTTAHTLPPVEVGAPCQVDIQAAGGDGQVTIEPVGSFLAPGLALDPLPADPARVRIAGTPSEDLLSYLYLRTVDTDGDPAWRTFSLATYGGPGTLVESDFTGSDPARHLPWTNTYVTAPDVAWSGWQAGSGIVAEDGDNGLFYSVAAPADEDTATLALALSDEEYWYATLTPQAGTIDLRRAEVRLVIRRVDYHAPRVYAFMTSVEGFDAGSEVATTERNNGTADQEVRFELPDRPAYQDLSGPVEIRIVGYAGQYSGHVTSIVGFKLRERQ